MSSIREQYYQLIRYGTEFLGLDLKYFASGGFWTTLGQSVNGVLALLLTIAFANLLPKETYGLYRYILSLSGLFSIFSLTGMNAAVSQAVAAGNEGALRTSVKYQLKWNLTMMAALFGLSGYYLWNQNSTLAVSLFILGALTPLTSALNTYSAFLDGKKEFKLNNIFAMVSTAVYAAGTVLALYFSKDVIVLVAAYALITFAINLFLYIRTLKLFSPPETPSVEALAYGRKLTYISWLSPIVSQIDKIVLTNFWGVEQLAVYALASAIPERVGPFIKDLTNLGTPKLAIKTLKDINKVFYKRIFQALILGAVVTLGYILLAPIVFKYLLPKYMDSVFYSQILAIGFIFAAPLGYLGAAFTSQKMIQPIIISNVLMSAIKIILYVVLGIWGGILGLVLAQLVYYFIGLFLNIALWKFNK